MACNQSSENELHRYLNGELNHEAETNLKHHLMSCRLCQEHYQELRQVDQQLSSLPNVEVPNDLKQNIIKEIPRDTKVKKFSKVIKEHPLISAAVVFFIMMFISTISEYHSNEQLSLSKHEGVITQGNRVIIPAGEVIQGDFIVRNAEVVLEGKIRGDLTLVNSHVVDVHEHHDTNYSSFSHHVDGKVVVINRYFAWMHHKIEYEFKNFVTFVTP